MNHREIERLLQHPQSILQADGSSRRFFRLKSGRRPLLAILPPEQAGPKELAEARSVACIGRHLHARGAATPEIFAWDAESGLVLCEDFGDTRLQDIGPGHPERLRLYEETVVALAFMQVKAAEGFDPAWCWDTPRYDEQLMQERESGYFLQACCRDLLGLSFDGAGLAHECRLLAASAAQAPACYFLHRDCQSRNVMLPAGLPAFIDFQGGRLGPLAYDLASLLIDPYAALPEAMQAHLLEHYLAALLRLTPYDPERFRHEYQLLAVQRNLQIMGAFAFLSQVRGKPFFAAFLAPAAASLATLLAHEAFARYAGLRNLACLCHQHFSAP